MTASIRVEERQPGRGSGRGRRSRSSACRRRASASARSGRPLSISAWPTGVAAQERVELAVGERLEARRLGLERHQLRRVRRGQRSRRVARASPLRNSSWVQPLHAPICLPASSLASLIGESARDEVAGRRRVIGLGDVQVLHPRGGDRARAPGDVPAVAPAARDDLVERRRDEARLDAQRGRDELAGLRVVARDLGRGQLVRLALRRRLPGRALHGERLGRVVGVGRTGRACRARGPGRACPWPGRVRPRRVRRSRAGPATRGREERRRSRPARRGAR